MADDEDVIYVDVVPRLDEGAADEVAGELKDKVQDATDGIGGGLKQAAKDAFDQLKDAIDPKELGQAVGKSLGDAVGDELGNVLPDKVGDSLQGALAGNKTWSQAGEDIAKELGSQIGSKLGGFLSDSFSDLTGLDLGGVKDTITNAIGTVTDNLSGAHDQIHAAVGNIKDTLEELGLGGVAGGTLAPALTSAAGPVAASVASTGLVEDALKDLPGIGPTAQDLLPDGSLSNRIAAPFRMIGGDIMHPSRLWNDQRQYDNNGNFIGDGPQAQDNTDLLYKGVFGSSGGGGGGTTSANEVDVQSSVATVTAGQVTLGGSISLPQGAASALSSGGSGSGLGAAGSSVGSISPAAGGGTSVGAVSGDAYSALGSFSEGGDVTGPGPTGVDSVLAMLAPGEGVLTPSQNQLWKSLMKGIPHFAGGGDVAAPAAPDASGSGGGGSDEAMDAIGQPGEGGNAPGDQSSGGAPGTSDTSAPGAVQDASDQDQAYDAIGQPGQDVTDPTQQGIVGGTKTSKGIQEQSYGYGKGFQVTGQGLIGFAESAPGAIASAAASGASGGPAPAGIAAGAGAAALTSLWNTIGQPELNEAITEGVKIGADLASAPSQEFAVGGENFQNWSQKLIGGEIGNVTNLINTAANTAAPLTQQDNGNQSLAGQAAGGNGTLGGQPSPAGTQGDPMHVSIVGSPSGGSQNDAMSSVGMDSSGTA